MFHNCGGAGMGIQLAKGFRCFGVARMLAGVTAMAVAALPAMAQVGPQVTTGRPTDWTHHRLVFSNPGTLTDADKKGNTLHVQAVLQNTRFQLEQMRRNPLLRPDSLPGAGPQKGAKTNPNAIHKDWSENLSVGLVNPNAYPAKFSFTTTAFSCVRDFVAYPTGIAGTAATQATIVAYDELYGTNTPNTGCGTSATVPTVYWSYDTSYPQGSTTNDGSVIKTSPVLSLDGTQVAFIQVAGTTANLVLLKWAASATTVAMDTATNNVTNANYRACTAPCMTRIALNGAHNDTWSAPFYDYDDDIIYVGDDSGELHQISDVFLSGTPTETGHVALGATILASPVYDSTSGLVFVGSEAGILYSVTASTMAVSATSGTLAASATAGIFDAPLVDSTAGKVYVFVAYAVTASGCTNHDNCVFQFATNFANGTFGTHEALGTGNTTTGEQYLFDGDFDNIYYSSSAGTAGNLYVEGFTDPGLTGSQGSLYRIPISGTGTMSAPVVTATSAAFTEPYPSPVTEFCNNGTSACVSSGTATTSGTDYIFFSAHRGNATGCTSSSNLDGCVLAYNVSSGAAVFSSFLQETYTGTFNCFVTGGLVVDNAIPSGTEAGASEIYFMGLNGTTTNLCGNAGGGDLTGVQSAQ